MKVIILVNHQRQGYAFLIDTLGLRTSDQRVVLVYSMESLQRTYDLPHDTPYVDLMTFIPGESAAIRQNIVARFGAETPIQRVIDALSIDSEAERALTLFEDMAGVPLGGGPPSSCLTGLRPDEPYFVFKGSDRLCYDFVDGYAQLLAKVLGADHPKVVRAARAIAAMRAYEPKRLPD